MGNVAYLCNMKPKNIQIMTTDGLLHGTAGQWTDTFTLKGVDYYCTKMNPHPLHRTGGVMVDLGREEYVSSDCDNKYVVMPRENGAASIVFSIHTINKYVMLPSDEPIVVGIYRKGEPVPIYYKEHDMFVDDILDTLDDYEVTPGEYFLVMGNVAPYDHLQEQFKKLGNFYVFSFTIVEHGSKLSHPILLEVTINDKMAVHTLFHYSTDLTDQQIFCECYDPDFRLVGDTVELLPPGVLDDDPYLRLKEKGWWLNGKYNLVIYHNKEPFAQARFVSHDGVNDVFLTDTLHTDDILYKLCKDVQKSGKKHMFCLVDGCGKLKKRILEYLCSEHEHVNEHLMFCAEGLPDYEVMHPLTGVMHPHYNYKAVTVKELMKAAMTGKDPSEAMDMMMAGCSTVLYGLSELTNPVNEGFARMLLKVAAERHGVIILYGKETELERVLNMYPEWKDILVEPQWWNVYSYTQRDAIRSVERILKRRHLTTSPVTLQKLADTIHDHWDIMKDWRKADYEKWVASDILLQMKKRLLGNDSFSASDMQTVQESDVVLTRQKEKPEASFGYSLAGLDRMVGLNDVKEHLKLMLKRMDFDRKREKLGLRKLQTGRPHMVFTGNPGTGKTTVAKLLGQAFKQLGYLSVGDVVCVERSQMVGRYIGETEQRMTQLLKKAKGNVLFIDEAYSLCDNNDGDRKDFGCRALECLLPMLADEDSDIIVILAGYEKEMNEMMGLNPGMKGRFPYWFKFEDYGTDELHEIALRLLKDNDYRIPDDASNKLKACIGEAIRAKDRFFHNARWANQLVQDGVLAMMAERLYDTEANELNRDLFGTVTEEDVTRGFERMRCDRKATPVRKVGFR